MEKPLVSVIILTYNQEQTIARSIDSVLSQICTFPYEIILGEDCSTDNTLKICIEYAEKYPEIIKLRHNNYNKGVIDNYYDCFLECSGKYIADCAGDDFWIDPNKLQQQVEILENDNSLSAVHTDWFFYDTTSKTKRLSDPNGIYNKFRRQKLSGKDLIIPILTQKKLPIIHLCTTLYRVDIIRNAYNKDMTLFRNKQFTCEDLQLAFILALNGNIAYLDTPTICYTIRDNSISNTKEDIKQYTFSLGIIRLCNYISSQYNITDLKLNIFLHENIFKLLMHLFRSRSIHLIHEIDNEVFLLGGYNLKCKILRFILKHNVFYYPAKKIRDFIVSFKN